MWDVIKTATLWACLPFLALAVWALILNLTWWSFFVVLLVICSPLIVGFLYGFITGMGEWSDREARRTRSEVETARRHVHEAFLTETPFETPPLIDPPAKPAPTLKLKGPLGNQWRA